MDRKLRNMKMATQRWIGGGVLALLFVSSVTVAEGSESLRGTIKSVDGQSLVVITRSGASTNVKLAGDAHVFTLKAAALAEVKAGGFVGVVISPQPNGTEGVVELYIFPSDPERDPFDIPAYGLFSPRDVAEVVNYLEGSVLKNDRQALTVRRRGRDDTISVSADANIFAVTPATAADIWAGQKVFVPNGRPMSTGLLAPTIILGE